MGLVGFATAIGILAFLIGIFLLLAPSALKRLNEISANVIARIDSLTFSYRIGFGVSLIIVAAFMFFMAYYFEKRY